MATIKMPDILDINAHPYRVYFNKLLIDGHAFARSSMSSEILQLNPTNTDAQNTVSFWHEILEILYLNLIGENMSENEACAISEGLCQVFKDLGIYFDFSKINEMTDDI